MPKWPILKTRERSSEVESAEPHEARADRELIIGTSLRFRGELEVAANLRIEGTVKGSISAGDNDIVIEEGGLAEANVHAGSVTVRGTVLGAIIAQGTVKLEATAKVDGPIHAARVALEDGCQLSGRIDVSAGSTPAPSPAQPVIAGRCAQMTHDRQMSRDRTRDLPSAPG